MKNIREEINQREARIEQLIADISALRRVAPMLTDKFEEIPEHLQELLYVYP